MGEKHYEVGYGKPPKQYQFQTGNPGRSRLMRNIKQQTTVKHLTVHQLFSKVLEELVRVSEGGKSKKMTRMEVFVRSLINEAIKGDKSARRDLIALAPKLVEPPGVEIWTTRVTEETRRLWHRLLAYTETWKEFEKSGLPERLLSAMKKMSGRPEKGSNNSAEHDQDA
jgi:hypothetical protein